MKDWIMIVITLVYVVATSLMSVFNYRMAKATREQLIESRRQFDESNRPSITVELITEKGYYYALRFTNHGSQPAGHVRITLAQDFIDSVPDEKTQEMLKKQSEREFLIGVKEHYDLFFGSREYRENTNRQFIKGTVFYENREKSYEEPFNIDPDYYLTYFSLHNESEDMLKSMDNQFRALQKIAAALERAYPPEPEEEKEEESAKAAH